MIMDRTGWSLKDIAERVDALIVTRGGKGSHIYTQTKTYEIPTASVTSLADPTGCGDAYRAGLLHGLINGMDWETTGRIASLDRRDQDRTPGPQNHFVTPDEFRARFQEGIPLRPRLRASSAGKFVYNRGPRRNSSVGRATDS